MSGEENEVETEEEVVSEEIAEAVAIPTREAILEKISHRETLEALKDLLDYVDAKVQELLEKVIGPLGEKTETHAELLRMLKIDIEEVREAAPMMEFTKEDRAAIVEAFKKVHTELGSALSALSAKEIGYKTAFNSRKGLLSVRLFKLADSS